MTAEVISFPTRGDRADATIRATVRALMEGRGWSKEDLAVEAHVSAATIYRRLAAKNPTPFKAGEVALVAEALGVSVAQLFDGLGGTFGPPDDDGVRREGIEPPTRWYGVSPSQTADVVNLDDYRNTGPDEQELAA